MLLVRSQRCVEQGSAGLGSCERGLYVGSETGGCGGGGARPPVALSHTTLVLQGCTTGQLTETVWCCAQSAQQVQWLGLSLHCLAVARQHVYILIDARGG